MPFDKVKDQRRGFVFIEYDSEEAVKKVLDESVHKMGTQEVCWILWLYLIPEMREETVNSLMM